MPVSNLQGGHQSAVSKFEDFANLIGGILQLFVVFVYVSLVMKSTWPCGADPTSRPHKQALVEQGPCQPPVQTTMVQADPCPLGNTSWAQRRASSGRGSGASGWVLASLTTASHPFSPPSNRQNNGDYSVTLGRICNEMKVL